MTLCGASAYTQTFYLCEEGKRLPSAVQDELKIMCALFTEEVGGVVTLDFDEDGELSFHTDADEDDFLYDEIGAALKVKRLREEKRELLEALETWYAVFLGNKEG